MKKIILLFLLLFASPISNTFAQTSEIRNYYHKADAFQKSNLDSTRHYLLKGLKIAEKRKDKSQIVKGNWQLANLALKQRNRTIADSIFTFLLQHPSWTADSTFYAINIDYAHLLYLERKTDKALSIYATILPYLKTQNNFKLLVHCSINLSKLMILKHQFKKAMQHLVEAEKVAQKHQLESKLAIIYGTMGRLYFQEKEYDQSLGSFEQSLFYHTKLNNIKNIAVCHQSIGTLYILKDDLNKAESELREAGRYFQKAGYQHQYLTVLNNLGVLYKRQKQYTKAKENYTQTLQLAQQLGNQNMQSTALLNMSQVAILQKNYNSALRYIQQSLKLAIAANETDFREIYQDLATIYELKGEYTKAFQWLNRYTQHADSILNIQKYKAVEDLKLKYESEKKELLIEKMSLENKTKEATILRERIIAGSISMLFIVAILLLLLVRREALLKIESYKKLVEKNEISRLEREKERSKKLNTSLKKGENKIQAETRQEVLQQLAQLIDKKFYTNIELTLSSTAQQTHTNSKYLSQIVNETYECHFSNFIKQLRLEEAERLLSDKSLNYFTIEGIGEKAGFKSKSVFNTSFKQMTGVTPSFYRKQVQKGDSRHCKTTI